MGDGPFSFGVEVVFRCVNGWFLGKRILYSMSILGLWVASVFVLVVYSWSGFGGARVLLV